MDETTLLTAPRTIACLTSLPPRFPTATEPTSRHFNPQHPSASYSASPDPRIGTRATGTRRLQRTTPSFVRKPSYPFAPSDGT